MLAYLDAVTRQRGGRRGRRCVQTGTGGLILAHTRHATSRAGDPCPHDHVLLANVVEMGDVGGGWKAADTVLWREELHAATMVGRVAAARAAVEAGFAIEADPGPSGRLRHWRIAGMPDEVLAVHSKRSAEIDAHLDGRWFGSPRARAVAARETRKAKRFEGAGKLTVRWRKEVAAAGWPVSRLLDSVEQAAHGVSVPAALSAAELEGVVRTVVDADGALARRKVFGRAEVIVAAAPLLFGRPISDLDRAVGAVLADAAVVPLVGVADARDRQYTLAATIATELAIAATVAEGAAPAGKGVVPEAAVAEAVGRVEDRLGRSLTAGQADAVRGICTGGCPVSLVLGVAGSGKTTSVAAVADAYRRAGFRVLGTATSGQAARTLGTEAGLEPSSTLASLLWRIDHGRLRLDGRDVIVLDETGMTDDPDLLRLLAAAKTAEAKVVLIGDDHQLGPVGPGGALGALLARHEGVVHVLDENVRQADPAERRALSEVRAGSVEAAVVWYRRAGRVRCAPDRDTAVEAVVDGWAADVAAGRDAVMLAWRRDSVERLNRRAREAWAAMGRLGRAEPDAPGGRRYAAGDLVVALAPAANGAVVTSQRGVVTGAYPEGAALDVRLDDGVTVRLAGEQLGADRLGYSYALTVHRAQGLTADTCHHFGRRRRPGTGVRGHEPGPDVRRRPRGGRRRRPGRRRPVPGMGTPNPSPVGNRHRHPRTAGAAAHHGAQPPGGREAGRPGSPGPATSRTRRPRGRYPTRRQPSVVRRRPRLPSGRRTGRPAPPRSLSRRRPNAGRAVPSATRSVPRTGHRPTGARRPPARLAKRASLEDANWPAGPMKRRRNGPPGGRLPPRSSTGSTARLSDSRRPERSSASRTRQGRSGSPSIQKRMNACAGWTISWPWRSSTPGAHTIQSLGSSACRPGQPPANPSNPGGTPTSPRSRRRQDAGSTSAGERRHQKPAESADVSPPRPARCLIRRCARARAASATQEPICCSICPIVRSNRPIDATKLSTRLQRGAGYATPAAPPLPQARRAGPQCPHASDPAEARCGAIGFQHRHRRRTTLRRAALQLRSQLCQPGRPVRR